MSEREMFLYLIGWLAALLAAMILLVRGHRDMAILNPHYWTFLLVPWKLLTFVAAVTGLVIIAPYTGDPTWDYVDALFMAVLAFATAPWTVGVFFRALRGSFRWGEVYVACCVWMFSVSWSYDLYLLIRDGHYPVTWYANIGASSILYACAGLLWNLVWTPEAGVSFGFMQSGWPNLPGDVPLVRVFWLALPLMLIVTIAILSFLVPFRQ